MNKLTVVVPVRAGSERIKNKNLALIGSETLLARKIRTLKDCKNVETIVVNSDSDEMLGIARAMGVVTVKRDPAYAASSTPINEAIYNIFSNAPGEHVMWAQTTNPLVSAETIDRSIETYFEKRKEGFDSLASCVRLREFLWDEKGPLNYEKGKMPRSQDLKPVYRITFSMMIIERALGMSKKYYMGDRPFFFELDTVEGIDIDYEEDLFIANAFYQRSLGLKSS